MKRSRRRRSGHAYARVPLAKVVIYEGGPGARKGTRRPWVADVYDVNGDVRSSVSDNDRAYVERKVAEFWPGVPIEMAPPGAMSRSAWTRQ